MMILTMETEKGAFTAADFRGRAAHHAVPLELADEAVEGFPHFRGDHELNPGIPTETMPRRALRPAAVLVPVVDRDDGATVILTLRASHLASHAGQVAFPGGKVAPGDATIIDTALREAEEEIGLMSRFVTPVGMLDIYRTGTGFHVVPVLAVVSPGFTLAKDEQEVADVFEVPLEFLMTEANHQRHAREIHGVLRHFHAMPYGERYIWGATAGILRAMYERLYCA